MIPSPPDWIRTRITAWPKLLQYVGVSTTIRPVTQIAEVAVKKLERRRAPGARPCRGQQQEEAADDDRRPEREDDRAAPGGAPGRTRRAGYARQ